MESLVQPDPTLLLHCGHAESPHSPITRGYGTDREGKQHCYACCHAQDLQVMSEHGIISGYVSSDATQITNWPGSVLATIVHKREHKAGYCNFGWRDAWISYTARAADGTLWHGRGSRGMLTTMRRSKAKH